MNLLILSKAFYERNPEKVAKGLLGKKLIRKTNSVFLEGIIVETEAYYGFEDPASRAYHGLKDYNKLMWDEPGFVFIYNVHNNWMFNIIAYEHSEIGAVLIRAIEPTKGIETMMKNRPVSTIHELTNGPGKMTKALKIDKVFSGASVTSEKSKIFIVNSEVVIKIGSSHRIGVKKDLEKKLRFFIMNNKFVSK